MHRFNKVAPQGWFYEAGDPSVGIFGGEWVHEDCTVLQGPGSDEAKGVDDTERQVDEPNYNGVAQVAHLLTCKDCGQEVVFEVDELVGVPE